MVEKYEFDSVDKRILKYLKADARMPYLEIARKLLVSGGTVHQRINRMVEMGVIKGSTVQLDQTKLGIGVVVLLGIHLRSAKGNQKVVEKLKGYPEVMEAYFTTGNYALIAKIGVKSIQDFHQFLVTKLQAMEEIQSTESFICLDQPIDKGLQIPD